MSLGSAGGSSTSSSSSEPQVGVDVKSLLSDRSSKSISKSQSGVLMNLTTEDVKHKILTQKAKMYIKPHLKTYTRDYLEMVREEKDFKNQPEWDSSECCLMRDVVLAKKNNALAFSLLKKKRDEQAKMRVERDKEIEELRVKENMFGVSFVFFDKFIKENIEKRERATEKINSEKLIQNDLELQIEHTKNKIQRLKEIKRDMIKCIDDRKQFVDFLEKVRCLAPDQFRNGVHEIAERYELLMLVRENLAQEQKDAIDNMENLNLELFKINDDCAMQLFKLRHKVTELYCRYDTVKHDALYWASLSNKIEGLTSTQTTELTRVKNACWNLYLEICENHKLPVTLQHHEIRKQLAVIENNIVQMRRTLYLVKKKYEKTTTK